MRLIWQSDSLEDVRKYSSLLRAKNIEHTTDSFTERDWGSEKYGVPSFKIWIHDEDKFPEAEKLLTNFLEDPSSCDIPVYEASSFIDGFGISEPSPTKKFLENKLRISIPPQKMEETKIFQAKSYFTNFLVILCSVILLLEFASITSKENPPPEAQSLLLTVSSVEKELLFDYPKSYELLDKLLTDYGYQVLTAPEKLPPSGQLLYMEYLKTPSFRGIYPMLVNAKKSSNQPPEKGSILFEKIRQGELYRLITPVILHGGFLHLFFNMIWLMVLGTQIEKHLRIPKYILFIAIVAIVSNVCQYFMTGPAFVGFSGVICGMVFFIRGRQKIAAWESYVMTTATFNFILFFIGTLTGLSVLSFIFDFFHIITLPIAIANTAHIAGAITGWVLSRFSLFAMKS